MSEQSPLDNRISVWLPRAAVFMLGVLAGLLMGKMWFEDEQVPQEVEMREGGYQFINPLLECEAAKDTIQTRELKSFKSKIQALILDQQASKAAVLSSVYFRDLNNGPWFGLNEREPFTPASLLKVPIMMSYFKLAESRPEILKKRVTYERSAVTNAMENIKASNSIEPGKTYTVEDLIRRMIVYSDNEAGNLLMQNINVRHLAKTHEALGVNLPDRTKGPDYMPVKAYAAFFRILFNASYLNREMSQKALEYLSESDYKDGLVAGVPANVTVSHKFGERAFNDTGIRQLHDCGIVYYPNHPYLLCVMTRGHDFATLSGVIRNVSRMVYSEVDAQY